MADPLIVNCPKDAWIEVTTNVTSGQIHKLLKNPSSYLSTYRETGETAPTIVEEGIPIFINGITEQISASVGIDVYIYAVGKDGQVRVDL